MDRIISLTNDQITKEDLTKQLAKVMFTENELKVSSVDSLCFWRHLRIKGIGTKMLATYVITLICLMITTKQNHSEFLF